MSDKIVNAGLGEGAKMSFCIVYDTPFSAQNVETGYEELIYDAEKTLRFDVEIVNPESELSDGSFLRFMHNGKTFETCFVIAQELGQWNAGGLSVRFPDGTGGQF